MRLPALFLALALWSCATPAPPPQLVTLTPSDAATSLAMGGPVTMTIQPPPVGGPEGEDPLILMILRSSDGRAMSFDESNHAPTHVMAQAPGGALAQIMGLPDAATPKLYGARHDEDHGAPFICAPDGPLSIGYYEAPDGSVTIFGLKQGIGFETHPDGTMTALPYSPDQICARLHFRRS
jgi:hypothetical protein